jgi:hypothetical protein
MTQIHPVETRVGVSQRRIVWVYPTRTVSGNGGIAGVWLLPRFYVRLLLDPLTRLEDAVEYGIQLDAGQLAPRARLLAAG